jgi:hypothetical protein
MTGLARVRLAVAGIVAVAGTTAVWLLACGPFLNDLKTTGTIAPAHLDRFARGELAVVRPRFARRYLVHAYRRMNGRPAIDALVKSPAEPGTPAESAVTRWEKTREVVPNSAPRPPIVQSYRRLPDYQTFENCLDDAFVAAAATLRARADRFGLSSPQLRDWLRAQDAVFANCGGEQLVLPDAAPAAADPLVRADRAYQTAAAYFYAMQFDEAGRRFRAIADDAGSPWRVYGRYLAARAAIRSATVPEQPAAGAFARAEADLRAVIQDPSAAVLHESARGLLDLIALRSRPIERVRALSATLARSQTVDNREVRDYQMLMDRLLGDTTTFAFSSVKARDALAKDDDLASWILAMQATGEDAFEHALREWRRLPSVPSLIAVLWKIPPRHEAVASALRAAAGVPRDSPALATIAFLRVRLLGRAGRADEARALLASLPTKPAPGFPPEAINLLNAERFMLATTFEALLASAPRLSVVDAADVTLFLAPESPRARIPSLAPVFDNDAGLVFSDRLPLSRLVDAARTTVLPDRLRLRIATVAFTRAAVLGRNDEAVRLVPVLKDLSPPLIKDLEVFERAETPDARHRAAIALLLRTPGLHARVQGLEDDWWYARGEAARELDHTFRRNWWCGPDDPNADATVADSETSALLFGSNEVPPPAFLTPAERTAAARERTALGALGPGPNYLADEAVKWARARPQETDAAEMLALAVEGTRWGCTDARTTAASRRAFQTLHRLFPETEWARRTKYWY